MKMKRFSAYDRAVEYLTREFQSLYEEGFNTEGEYLRAIDDLSKMSVAEVMSMYKAWKDY